MKSTTHKTHSLIGLWTIIFFFCLLPVSAKAAEGDISIHNNENLVQTLYYGATGKIIPVWESDFATKDVTYSFHSDNDQIIQIDENGSFSAIEIGSATIYISGERQVINQEEATEETEIAYTEYFEAYLTLTVTVDMTNVTLSTDYLEGYLSPTYYSKKPSYYDEKSFTVNVNSAYPLSSDSDWDDIFQYSTTNPNISVDASLYNNVITIYASSSTGGITDCQFTIYGKPFTIRISLVPLGISKHSCLLVKKKTQTLTISGYSGPVLWESSNPSIATVSPDGVVTGKKIGNCIIRAKVGDVYLGCAVSVTTKKLKKVVNRATYIGTHWKYSQAKRTKTGYYDCSALVWKAYTKYTKINFGSKGYPGVALSEAKWCKSHGKMLKGGMTTKKVKKMQVNPGDLLFKSSDMKHKYNDIYHVEMFTGYYCYGVDDSGTASIGITWAARQGYYGWEEGSLLGRPTK